MFNKRIRMVQESVNVVVDDGESQLLENNTADLCEFGPSKEGVQSSILDEDLITTRETIANVDQNDAPKEDKERVTREPSRKV